MSNYIPQSIIEDIRNRTNIVDIVGEYVNLKRYGNNFKGLCPFHSEKTPSFVVNEEKQIFKCFGCGIGGDVFTFLKNYNNSTFPEAVKLLGNRYGIQLNSRSLSPELTRKFHERESLLKINNMAMNCYKKALNNEKIGLYARNYLQKRNIKNDVIETFDIGYAPSGWNNILRYFSREGISLINVEKAGLIIKNNNARYYDRFRDRIIFPIKNRSGEVIGFGGRVLDDSLPKYLNSPETSLYHKSKSLYGFYQSQNNCRKEKKIFIVEGYFDLIALYKHNIKNAVATLGTSLTKDHIRLIKGYVSDIIMVYDSDEAGLNAVKRSIELFKNEGVDFRRRNNTNEIEIRLLILPKGDDPDSYLDKYGAESFIKLADEAKGIIPFILDWAINKYGLNINGKAKIISELKNYLSLLYKNFSDIEFDESINIISDRLNINYETILNEVRNEIKTQSNNNSYNVYNKTKDLNKLQDNISAYKMEKKLLSMILNYPDTIDSLTELNLIDAFEDDNIKTIIKIIIDKQKKFNIDELMSIVETDKQRQLIANLTINDENWDKSQCNTLLNQFKFRTIRIHKQRLKKQIEMAEINKDYDMVQNLQKKLFNLNN